MSRATVTATSVLRRYFASRGEKTPQVQAESFIPRIMMHRDGSWRSDDLVDTATAILASAAIDVDDLVENYLEITLSIEPLHEYDRRAGAQVFGMAFPSTREIVICERAEPYQPLYRTCVAHELGHILLHHAEAQERVLAYAPFANARPPEEREADEFMTHLLSPKSVILLACALAAHQSGLHLAEVLGRANSKAGSVAVAAPHPSMHGGPAVPIPPLALHPYEGTRHLHERNS